MRKLNQLWDGHSAKNQSCVLQEIAIIEGQNSYIVLLINTRCKKNLFYEFNMSKTRDEDGFICLAALHGNVLSASLMSSSITIHILFKWKIQNDTDVIAYDSVDFNLNIS